MRNTLTYLSLLLTTLFVSCARIGSPTGGPKDTIPPVLAIAKPENKTLNFNQKKIVILFDEYIKFKQLNKQLIISPPMDTKPIIKPQGGVSKKITVEILDTLKPNTTYTINFGNSIVDNNEGNQLGKLNYVFSTGTILDSLVIGGVINDPLANEKTENISILAYKNAHDSIIGKQTPYYVTNTLKDNVYQLENLSEATYTLIALQDKNNNYKYDKGSEKIGFLDQKLTLNHSLDSIDFTLFKEDRDAKIFNPKQTKGNQLLLAYRGKEIPKLKIKGSPKENYLISKDLKADSLYVWFKELPKDSITIFAELDTLQLTKTLKIRELKKDTLLIKTNISSILHPNDSLFFTTNIPVNTVLKDSIQLFESDSIPIAFSVITKPKQHKIWIDFIRKANQSYFLEFKKEAFKDFLNNHSKTKLVNFKTQDPEEYGELILNIQNTNSHNLIVQLLDSKNRIITSKIISKSDKINFKNLEPLKYKIRIIKDLNKNNQFDNGSFLLKTQPEPVYNHSKELKIRANSEINENILLD